MMELIFPLVFGVAIIEMILSGTWNVFYFRSGFPIYRRERRGIPIPSPITDAEKIESLIPESKCPKLLFRKADKNFFIFRERAFQLFGFNYTPIMHGNLIIDPLRGQIEVIGRLNWFVLIFSIVVAGIPMYWEYGVPVGFIFLAFLAVLLSVIYTVQKKRFDQVADLVAQNMANLL